MNKRELFNFYCKFLLGLNLIKLKLTNSRAPLMANLIITNRCNLECFYCYVDVFNPDRQHLNLQEKRVINRDNLIELVDTLYDRGCRLIVLLGGEPLMFKEIGEIIRHINKNTQSIEI
jgi:molybdenum cofactor biosynthesis enzyme MoaA